MIHIETVVVGPFGVNCFIVWAHPANAIVIDPGDDAKEIEAVLNTHALTVGAYLLTHGHVDHVSALAGLHRSHPAPVAMAPQDQTWCFTETNRLLPFYTAPRKPDSAWIELTDGTACGVPDLSAEVIATPGHTPGSVCFLFRGEGVLFTGDTLFAGSAGRTDLPGGDGAALAASLTRLLRLPDSLTIYPGHGSFSTLARERETNPFMRE